MPFDWLFEVENIIIRLVPAYTLEALDKCDINRLLPYYFFDYRKALRAKSRAENGETEAKEENIVIRDGKKYRKVKGNEVSWADKIF